MIAHVYAVSLEMALIAICAHTDHCHSLLRIQARGQLSDGSDTSCLLFKIPYVVPLLVGLGGKPGIRDSRRMRRVPVLPAHICEAECGHPGCQRRLSGYCTEIQPDS